MSVLDAELSILDEIDSGLDIDALKDVASAVNGLTKPETATIMVTHYKVTWNPQANWQSFKQPLHAGTSNSACCRYAKLLCKHCVVTHKDLNVNPVCILLAGFVAELVCACTMLPLAASSKAIYSSSETYVLVLSIHQDSRCLFRYRSVTELSTTFLHVCRDF